MSDALDYSDASVITKAITENPHLYDNRYGQVTNRQIEDARNAEDNLYPGVSKDVMSADVIKSLDLDQLLGEVQRRAAQQRESALVNTTVSLYRRLGLDSHDLAEAYDEVDRQTRYSEGREHQNPTSRMAGPMTWNR